jgi:hypothetical protein
VLTLRMGHGVDGAGECVSVSEESVEVLGVKMTGPAWRGPAWVVDGQAEGRDTPILLFASSTSWCQCHVSAPTNLLAASESRLVVDCSALTMWVDAGKV